MKIISSILFYFIFFQSNGLAGIDITDRYLVDSTGVHLLISEDSTLLHNSLKLFHSCKNDSCKLNALDDIIQNMMDPMWERYNAFVFDWCLQKLTNKALEEDLKTVYLKHKSSAENNFGYISYHSGLPVEALEYWKSALKTRKDINDDEGVAATFNNLAIVYEDFGLMENAIEYHKNSLLIREKIGDSVGMTNGLNNMGYLHEHQNDLKEAMVFYRKSFNLAKKINNPQIMGITLNNMALVLDKMGKRNKAFDYFLRALEIRKNIGDKPGVSAVLNNLAGMYKDQGKFALAALNYRKSYAISFSIDDKYWQCFALNGLTALHLKVLNFDSSLYFNNLSIKVSEELGYPSKIRDAHHLRYKILKATKDFENAFKYFTTYIQSKDSVSNQENQASIFKLNSIFELEKSGILKRKTEYEFQKQMLDEQNRRNVFQYAVVSVIIFCGMMISVLLGRLKMGIKTAEGLLFFSFLLGFEFILVLTDPWLESFTDGAPGFKLLINAIIALIIFPLHAGIEKLLKIKLLLNRKSQK